MSKRVCGSIASVILASAFVLGGCGSSDDSKNTREETEAVDQAMTATGCASFACYRGSTTEGGVYDSGSCGSGGASCVGKLGNCNEIGGVFVLNSSGCH